MINRLFFGPTSRPGTTVGRMLIIMMIQNNNNMNKRIFRSFSMVKKSNVSDNNDTGTGAHNINNGSHYTWNFTDFIANNNGRQYTFWSAHDFNYYHTGLARLSPQQGGFKRLL